MAVAATPPEARVSRRTGRLDLVVAVAALVLLAFPLVARFAADAQPLVPRPEAPLPSLTPVPGTALPSLPAGLPPGPAPARLDDLRGEATALLGARRGARLLAEVRTKTPVSGFDYSYPEFERWIGADVDPAAANALGARLTLLGAARAAYVLFTRAGSACEPRLNLLLLHAAESTPNAEAVAAAARRARTACPGDVRPGWLLGQFQSQIGHDGALATFRDLRRAFPAAAAAWSGEADALLRQAYIQPPERAFVTRHLYERALSDYRRAARLPGAGPDLGLGIARALAGLGRAGEAIAVQRRAIAALPPSALLQARLVEYLESARRFGQAAGAAASLSRMAGALPRGPGLFPVVSAVHAPKAIAAEDASGPLSLGAGRVVPLSVSLRNSDVLGPAPIVDLSFLPVFRPTPGVTGSERWCADWSRRRDALLAGRPAAARAGLPRAFAPVDDPTSECAGTPALIGRLAAIELGDRRAGLRGAALDALSDQRQNLWRWGGDLAHAERAARAWVQVRPVFLALIRLGEVEFLRHRFDDAARHFDAAARRARERHRTWSSEEAEALLKRGTALVYAGRRDEGLAALRAADDTAARTKTNGEAEALVARSWSYYALAQLGDAEREAGALRVAADDYAAAARLESRLAESGSSFRVEHRALNAAIVEIGLRRPANGLRLARRALTVDRENPLFLMTTAFAAERAGRDDEALRLNRAALASDPTAFPAANDLGVLLARSGRDDEAVLALRRAVGANRRYALGWFNLGVVLAGMGPARLAASQGSLARAIALDPALRDRERRPTIDARTYYSGLDVSRPLPPKWSFAATQSTAPERTAGLAAILLAAFGLARVLGASRSGRGLAETWLGPLVRALGRVPVPAVARHPGVALVGTLAVLLWPLARDPSGGLTAALAGVLGIAVLVAVALRARAAVARRAGEPGEQETWPPGVLFGLGTAVAGFTWAPLPVLRSAGPRVHWAAPVALACVALPLVALTAWLDVPLSRTLAATALVMAASLLTPIKPVDGGAITSGGGTAAGLTGLGLAGLLLLGLV